MCDRVGGWRGREWTAGDGGRWLIERRRAGMVGDSGGRLETARVISHDIIMIFSVYDFNLG